MQHFWALKVFCGYHPAAQNSRDTIEAAKVDFCFTHVTISKRIPYDFIFVLDEKGYARDEVLAKVTEGIRRFK